MFSKNRKSLESKKQITLILEANSTELTLQNADDEFDEFNTDPSRHSKQSEGIKPWISGVCIVEVALKEYLLTAKWSNLKVEVTNSSVPVNESDFVGV
uniref:Uncharacterized protein n=1 Tax=Syphacia muris TaxID=451379 RepID=A0A0N5A955_9BILA